MDQTNQPAPEAQAPEAPQFTPEQLAYQAYLAGEVESPDEFVDPRQQAPQAPTQTPQQPPVQDPAHAFWLQQQQQQLAYQQQMLAAQAAQAQQYAEYAEQAALQQYLATLDDEKRDIAARVYAHTRNTQSQLQAAQMQAYQAAQYGQQLEQAFLPLLKEQVLSNISNQYQVEKELLARTGSRAEAENLAKAISEYRRRAGWEARRVANSDRVPTTSQQTNAPTQSPEITRRYEHTGKIRDFVKDMKRAGLWD